MADCSKYLQFGFYDEFDRVTITSEKLYRKMTESKFESLEQMRSMATDLGLEFVVKKIPIKFNGSYKDEKKEIRTIQSELHNEFRNEFYQYDEDHNKLVSEKITNLVSQCLNKPGLNLWIVDDGMNNTFYIFGRNESGDTNISSVRIKDFNISPETSVEIKGENPFKIGSIITGKTEQLVVRRKDEAGLTIKIEPEQVSANWITSSQVPPLEVVELYKYNPTKEVVENYLGVETICTFINDKKYDLTVKISVQYFVSRYSPDEAHSVVGEFYITLLEKDGSERTLLRTGQKSFYKGAEYFREHAFFNIDAGETKTVKAGFAKFDRVDKSNSSIQLKFQY